MDMTDFEHSGGTEALRGFSSLFCGTSETAYSAAIKDQWMVHILYWFVCWISEWIFRCIYNGLIKASFDLKNTTITESPVLFASQNPLWLKKMSIKTGVFQGYSVSFILLIIKYNQFQRWGVRLLQ